MKFFVLSIAALALLTACPAPTVSTTSPTLKNWRVRLSSPSIDGMTPYIHGGEAWLSAANPFAPGTPVVLIGTPPPRAIPQAAFPYLMYGNNATSGAFHVVEPGTGISISPIGAGPSDVQNKYRLYPLDWTTVSNSVIAHSGEVFTVAVHGLQVGDTVYLAGVATNAKASDAYLVLSTPTLDTFTLSGAAPANGDSFHYLATVNATAGQISF